MNWNIGSSLSKLACNVNQLTTQPFRSGSGGGVLKINMLSLSLSAKAHEKEKIRNTKSKIQITKLGTISPQNYYKNMLLQNENNYNPMTF